MRAGLCCLAALAGRALAVARTEQVGSSEGTAVLARSADLVSDIAITEEQISELDAELASLLAGGTDSSNTGDDSWDGTTTLSADDCTETTTTTATIVTSSGSSTATLTATIIVVPTNGSSSGLPATDSSVPGSLSSSGTAPITTSTTSFLANATSSKPAETSYTTYTSLCTENGTVVTHTHSEPVTQSSATPTNSLSAGPTGNSGSPASPTNSSSAAPVGTFAPSAAPINSSSAAPTASSYTTFTSLCTENGTVVTHTHSQPIAQSSATPTNSSSAGPTGNSGSPASPTNSSSAAPIGTFAPSAAAINSSSAAPTVSSYTTFTSLCTENGTVVTHTHSQPASASSTPSDVTVTDYTTTYTTVCPATSTISKNGTTSEYTYSTTSTVTTVISTSIQASATASPTDMTVTDFTTVYTTVCPATSTISKDGTTSESTYITTSTVTSVVSSTIPVSAVPTASEVTVTDFTTVYTTVCPATSTFTKDGTTSESTYIATSTVTSVVSSTIPVSAVTTASEVTVTDFTTVYTTVCPATSTFTKDGTTSESTYIATSTVTSVVSSTIPVSAVTTASEVTVTDFTTVYTTVCPATSTFTKDGTTSEFTYTTTSTVTDVHSLTIPIGHTIMTSAPTSSSGNGGAASGSGSAAGSSPGVFSDLQSWYSSYASGAGTAASAANGESNDAVTATATVSETTIEAVPWGSYTPSSGSWTMLTTTLKTDYLTLYTTVYPVTSTGSDGSVTTGTTVSTVTSSIQTTVTTSLITGSIKPTSSAAQQPGVTAPASNGHFPAGNKTSTAAYGSGTGYFGANKTSSSSPSKPTNGTCIPCAGQKSSNYGSSGNQPFCGLTIDDNSYENIPQTCQTVEYSWEITDMTISPDGVSRPAFVINGQMPGPLVEANWGDWIIVHVKNSMQHNGSTIHWHGVRQNYTNEMDGVASITQCPIAPGESMTYKFRADNYGYSWYHSHFSLQAYEGVFGPILIHGPDSSGKTIDGEQNFVLQDWNHVPVDEMYDAAEDVVGGGPRTLDTGLINGMNTWNGGGKRFEMIVKQGSTYKFRFVNAAIQSTMKVYLDGHNFTVISADFVPIVPYETSVLSISNGERYEVLVTFDQDVASYWLRSDVASECSAVTNGLDIKAIVRYEGAGDEDPTSTANSYSTAPGDGCADEPLASLVPYYKLNAHSEDYSIDKTITIGANSQLLYKWSLSGTTFQSQWGDPTLLQVHRNGTVPDYSGQLAITVPDLGEWVYLIIDSPIPAAHPIHLHGHDFYILAQGFGLYDSSVELNLENPPRRDVAMMPANPAQGLGGHLVIAWKTDNPGAWLVHCHIGWHIAMGFALQVIEGLDDIAGTVTAPHVLQDTCSSWHSWAGDLAPFDSGV